MVIINLLFLNDVMQMLTSPLLLLCSMSYVGVSQNHQPPIPLFAWPHLWRNLKGSFLNYIRLILIKFNNLPLCNIKSTSLLTMFIKSQHKYSPLPPQVAFYNLLNFRIGKRNIVFNRFMKAKNSALSFRRSGIDPKNKKSVEIRGGWWNRVHVRCEL